MTQNNDIVGFKDVLKSYPPGEALSVQYELQPDYTPASRDWVGLFQVGWTSSRDYYTFEWAPTPENNKGMAKFAGRRLPPEDTHFYQFCYVSSNGHVRGASPPFQFTTASIKHNIDDLELVEVSEDSLMVLQQKTPQETEVERQLSSAQETLGTMELEKKQMSEQMVELQAERNSIVVAKDTQVAELQRQLKEFVENEKRLNEKVATLRDQNNMLMSGKNDEEAKHAIIVSQLSNKDKELSQQAVMITDLKEENRELKGEIQIRDSQVDDLTQLATTRGQEKEQLSAEVESLEADVLKGKGQIAEMMEQLEQKTIEIEQLNFDLDEAKKYVERAGKKVDEVQQELNIANENISELMGNEGALVIERPAATLPEPPTAPAGPPGTVDATVYSSLLEAFDNIQKYYTDAQKENVELKVKNDEMLARVETCRMRYEDLAKSHTELGRQRKVEAAKIRELEEQIEDFTQGCGTAVNELSARKAEIKQRDSALEALEQTLATVQQEFDSFRDRHDTEVHRRVEQCDLTKAALDQKIAELAKVQDELNKTQRSNEHLKIQLEGLKVAAARPADRTCPVCHTKFPVRMRQQDYENHVQGHFNK